MRCKASPTAESQAPLTQRLTRRRGSRLARPRRFFFGRLPSSTDVRISMDRRRNTPRRRCTKTHPWVGTIHQQERPRLGRTTHRDYRSGLPGPGNSHGTISSHLLDFRRLSCYPQREVAKKGENSKYNRMFMVLFLDFPFGPPRNDRNRRIIPNMVHTRDLVRGLKAGHEFLFFSTARQKAADPACSSTKSTYDTCHFVAQFAGIPY